MRKSWWSVMSSASRPIAVEIPAQDPCLSLHRYGFASKVHRCCRNSSSRFSPGFGCCINSSRSLSWLVAASRFAPSSAATVGQPSSYAAAVAEPRCIARFVVVGLCRPPCPAQGLRARTQCSVRSFSGSVDGAAHNPAVEATSTGWPHRASCSFLPCAASRQLRLTFYVRCHSHAP
jgi:hypothetical protein